MEAGQGAVSRVLIAEDEPALRGLLARVLADAGYEVAAAEDGTKALEDLDRDPFDLLLADVWMPGLTGLELLERVRASGRPLRVVLMTGDSTPETVLASIRGQACSYIRKPFTPPELLEIVRRTLATPWMSCPIEVLSATPQWVELLVPCERHAVDRIQDFLGTLESDLPQDVRDSVGAAFRELLLNAVEWGGGLDPSKKVRISYLRAKRLLLYRISDPGGGFRFEGLSHAAVTSFKQDPLRHAEVRESRGMRPGGLGILMARALVDEVIYNEAQNEVVLLKYLD
jgi:CheY-like chemotaxis protein/anti-sigma regulatory factor (Ser/Thr protein kinase)